MPTKKLIIPQDVTPESGESPDSPTSIEVAPAPSSVPSPLDLSASSLRQAVAVEQEKRQIIKDFVKSQLIEGTDFMVLPFGGNKKPTLLKPGAEKILSLFSLSATFEKDTDTWEMLGAQPGQVAYLCKLFKGTVEVAQGRGVAVVGEKGRDANSTVKIAEKRAKMDACLALGFSDYFTQDLDDMDSPEAKPSAVERQALAPVATRTDIEERLRGATFTFTVIRKEVLTSKHGNPYAKLTTEKNQTVVAFQNVMEQFEEGREYTVPGEWQRNSYGEKFVISTSALQMKLDNPPEDVPF
jgi:hypothetical protein